MTGKLAQRLSDQEASRFGYIACTCLAFWATLAAGRYFAFQADYSDYKEYLALASGQQVIEPVASRVLAPFLAGRIARLSGLDVRDALATVSTAGWLLAGLPAASLLHRGRVPMAWALVLATVPFPAIGFGYYLQPDGVAVLFVLVCFFGLAADSRAVAGAGAALAVLTRVTTAVPILLWSSTRCHTRAATLAGIAGVLLGIVLLKSAFAQSATNMHQMNGTLHLLLKLPFNALKNLLGIEFYLSTSASCVPIARLDVSAVPGLGHLTEIGYCGFSLTRPLYSLVNYLFTFGVAPILVGSAIWRAMRGQSGERSWKNAASLAVFAPLVIMFLISPMLGDTIERLFCEAYPLLFPIAGRYLPAARHGAGAWPLALIGYNIVGFVILAALSGL